MGTVAALTLAEASEFLDPQVSEVQLRHLVIALRVPAAGTRKTGRPGHPCLTYDAAELMRIHAAVAPWITKYGGLPNFRNRVVSVLTTG